MKILFSHGTIIKLFQIEQGNPQNYQNLRKFVQTNLPNVHPNFVVKYKDQDGDSIVIQSNKDIESLFGTKNQDYIRASISDQQLKNQNSDVSDDNDSNESDKNEDSMLHSDDGGDKSQILDRSFTEKSAQLENSISLAKPKQQQRITDTSSRQFKTELIPQTINHTQNSSKPIGCYLTMTTSDQVSPLERLKESEEKISEEPFRKEIKYPDIKETAHREAPKQQMNQQPNPEQRPEKPPMTMVSSSMLRSKIGQPTNDKNVARLVRTLFNEEFQQRLEALIPQLMQRLKKEVRASFPSLLSEKESVVEPVQQEPEVPKQQKIIHNTPCNGCMNQVIEGIRYKCLQCEENFCEQCEIVIRHPHNMLKMRFLQVKEEKFEKIIDPNIQFVDKCFYLASYFGGKGQDFKAFVEQHPSKTEQELFEEHFKKNGKKLKKRMGQRLNQMTQKLALYFGEEDIKYISLVAENPMETFESLVAYVKECGVGSEDQVEYKSMSDHSSVRGSLQEFSRQSSRFTLNSSQKPCLGNEEREQFMYFGCAHYQISQEKQPRKVKFMEEYFEKNQHLLNLEGMKAKFCEEVESRIGENWIAVGRYSSKRGTV